MKSVVNLFKSSTLVTNIGYASNIGCVPGTVNIYDSLYHNVVKDENKDHISSILGDMFSDNKNETPFGPMTQVITNGAFLSDILSTIKTIFF